MHNVAIIGGGGWGTTLSMLLSGKLDRVDLWCFEPEVALEINGNRANSLYLSGVKLPGNIRATNSLAEAVRGKEMIILALPAQHVRDIMRKIRPCCNPEALFVIASKGLEVASLKRLSEVVGEELGAGAPGRIVCISGPNHAEEVSRGIPTVSVVAGENRDACLVQELLMSDRFRVYTNKDVIGVELAGSLKNVITIAAGISDGLGFGDNTKAALLTRGLAEITRLGVGMGANPLTFAGLAGMGDLIGTATSNHSRNLWAGQEIGKGKNPLTVINSTRMIVEGYYTTKAAYLLAGRNGVEMPITTQVYQVLYEGKKPVEAVKGLMARDPREETEIKLV